MVFLGASEPGHEMGAQQHGVEGKGQHDAKARGNAADDDDAPALARPRIVGENRGHRHKRDVDEDVAHHHEHAQEEADAGCEKKKKKKNAERTIARHHEHPFADSEEIGGELLHSGMLETADAHFLQ